MDPTKPILDLYSTPNNYVSSHNHTAHSSYKHTNKNQNQPKYNRPPPQKQISYSELKQKYQELYQAYSEKVEKVNLYEQQLSLLKEEKDKYKQEVYRLQDKNEQLNASLLNKNVQLEEVYRQLQEDMKRGTKSKKSDDALDRLEEGLRQAVTSNFNLLREAALSEMKHC